MDSQRQQHTPITRDNAWWFIPPEHVQAVRALEGKLNDLVYARKALSRDEALDTLRSKLATKKDKEQAESILKHFIQYYERSNNILVVNKESLSLRIKCELFGNYSEDFANARIILERLLDNRSECVGKAVLHSLMKDLIDPEYTPCKGQYQPEQADIEADLEKKYKDKFKVAISILQKAQLAEQESDQSKRFGARQTGGRIRNTYRLTQNIIEGSYDDIEYVYECAIKRLRSLRLKAKAKGNTATKKKEIKKILEAQVFITNSLKALSVKNASERSVYHWFCMFLIMEYAHVDTSRVLEDIITYIRYNNIKNTPIPVIAPCLSKWEEGYTSWSAFEELLVKETCIPIKWSTTVIEDDYIDASYRLIQDLTEVVSTFDAYERNKAKNKSEITDSQIEWIRDIKISLLYVRATIEMNSSHDDANGHFENLFKNVLCVNDDVNLYDLCLVVSKLNHLACEDLFEYAAKAKKWIYVLNDIPEAGNDYDVQSVLLDIYLHLTGMPSEEAHSEKYRKKCTALIKSLNPNKNDINQLYEVITQKYLYLLYSIESLRYQDVISWIEDLWNDIKVATDLADQQDPRIYMFKYDVFILAAKYLNKYLDFGYSLAILTAQAIIHLKRLGVKEQMSYFYLLDGLGEFVKDYDPEVALRAMIQIEPSYPNKMYINREIAIQLLDKGYIMLGYAKAKQAADYYECIALDDLESKSYYTDARLIQIKALYLQGESDWAEKILYKCRKELNGLEDLYEPQDRPCILQGVIDHCSDLDAEINGRPFYARELRLDYILVAIAHMEKKSPEIESFYEKWRQFNGMYMYHRECIDMSLVEEFESTEFPQYLEDIAKNVEFTPPSVDLSPLEDEDIVNLYDKLTQSYQNCQRTFLLNDDEEDVFPNPNTSMEMPSFDLFFELFQPRSNSHALISQIGHRDNSNDSTIFEDLEKYHFIAISDFSSRDEASKSADLFMKLLETLPISSLSVRAREMAADVLCQQSALVDFENWSEQEKLLNQAESFIVNKDGSIISEGAKEIYIRIMHRLYDVYDYQERSGLQESSMVKHALDLISTNDIRTVDAAWFLGERAEHLSHNQEDRKDAIALFERAIAILRDINPPTDDSLHYLEFYEDILSGIN